MQLSLDLLHDDPDLSTFQDENASIRTMVEGSYMAVVRHQGFAYTISCEGTIVGYYMIKVGAVKYYDSDAYDDSDTEYGALLVKYIIIDKAFRNKKIGSSIVNTIIHTASEVSKRLPIRFLVLEALDELRSWYERMGFQAIGTSKNSSTTTMIMDFINREELNAYIRTYEEQNR